MLKHKTFKPALISAVLLLTSTAALAQSTSVATNLGENISVDEDARGISDKKEATGILGGAVIGGLLAGPPGAIIMGVIGGLVANNDHHHDENDRLQTSLHSSQQQLSGLQSKHRVLEQQYQFAVEENQDAALIATSYSNDPQEVLCCDDSSLEIHFKTNSVAIESHYQEQLQTLSQLAETMPDAIIEISGYSDRRGTNSENHILSQNRIDAVQNALITLGASQHTMQTTAFGETRPLSESDSLEDNFFDRRVNITVRPASTEFITQNQ